MEDTNGTSSTATTRSAHSPTASTSHSPSPSHSASIASTSSQLPALLQGLRTHSRSTASSAISRPLTPLEQSPTKLKTRLPPPASLHRSISISSLAPPSLSSVPIHSGSTLASTSNSPDLSDQEDVDDDDEGLSDASSGFEGLLERVGAPPTRSTKSAKAKGKQRALDLFTSTDNGHPPELAPTALDHGQVAKERQDDEEQEDDDEDGDVELVQREEGQPDPRDMLRAQLRRSESVGRQGRLNRTVSSTIGGEQTADSVDMAPPAPRSRYFLRRYFILSSAGKLIFTTDPDEEEATGYVGVMQAIISIFADEKDKLRYVDAGSTKIAFLLKAPLYLVCVSDWGEPESVLRTHLDYLYLQVLSIVTLPQLTTIFSKRSNFDLRRLMEGTEAFFITLAERLQGSLAMLTNSLEVYRVDQSVREEVAKALAPGKAEKSQITSLSLLYSLVISHGRLVTLLRPSSHSIHPTDLHILLSTILSSSHFTTPDSESWIPICLPRFNNRGYLHAYISFVSEGVGVVVLSAEREGFEGVKRYAEGVKMRLGGEAGKSGLVHRLEMARGKQQYSLGELAIPGLRHFLYKSKSHVQVTHPGYEGDYELEENKIRLLTLYQRIHEAIHLRPTTSASGGAARPPAKLVYLRTEHEAVLGWTTSKFELYLAVSPLLPKTAVVSAARAVTRWIKPEELFLTSAPTF